MRHFKHILVLTAVSSALLLFNGAADARDAQRVVKKQTSIVKVARTEKGSRARHDNDGRRNDNANRHNNDNRRNDSRNRHENNRQHQSHHDGNRDRQPRYIHPRQRHDTVRHYSKPGPGYWRDYHYGRHPDYHHRYYHGHHYYYNHAGFYFPGFGFIAHGHVHGPNCPHWHFEPFAAGVLLGVILNN